MPLFCWHSLLSQQNALHLCSKTHPPTKDSWRRSDGRASSAWFVTQLLFAWQRTDTLSELSRNQLWYASTNASETLLNTSQDTYNQPISHHTAWQQPARGNEWYGWSIIRFLDSACEYNNNKHRFSSVLSDGVRPDQDNGSLLTSPFLTVGQWDRSWKSHQPIRLLLWGRKKAELVLSIWL